MKLLNCIEAMAENPGPELGLDLEGWNSDHPLFQKLVERVQPQTIIECGTFKGRSALHMAGLTKELGTKIYCCDNWLGDAALNLRKLGDDSDWHPCQYKAGVFYRQFLHNACASGHGDRLYPIPLSSVAGAQLLHHLKIQGDLIYIDGDHGYEQAYMDLQFFSGLLSPKGVLFGDDWADYQSVRMAVSRFAYENNLKVELAGPAWVLQPR